MADKAKIVILWKLCLQTMKFTNVCPTGTFNIDIAAQASWYSMNMKKSIVTVIDTFFLADTRKL